LLKCKRAVLDGNELPCEKNDASDRLLEDGR
jgi:hypothetical protein